MEYLQIYNEIYSNPDIEKRVVVACLAAADQVIHEDPITANHEVRVIWARNVISNPTAAARKLMPVMMVNPIVQAGNPTDNDILWLVQTNIEAYAPIM